MSLRLKIQLPIIALIMLIVAVSGYFSYRESARTLRESLVGNMRGEANGLVRALDTLTGNIMENVTRVASDGSIVGFFDQDIHDQERGKAFSAVLQTMTDSYRGIDRIALLDAKGIIVASTAVASMGQNFSDREYYKAAMQGLTTLSQPLKSRVSGKGAIIAASPVTKQGVIVGVAYCSIPLEGFYRMSVAPVTVGKAGFAFLLTKSGLIAAHRDADADPSLLFNPNLPDAAHYTAAVGATAPGLREFTDARGRRIEMYYARHESSGAVAVVQAEYDDVFAGLAAIRSTALIIGCIAVLFGIVLLWLMLRPVLNTLRSSIDFAGKIATGDLSGYLTVNRRDELGQLAAALRAIPATLKRIIAEYRILENNIAAGNLDASGDSAQVSGEFAALVRETNLILERFRVILDSLPSPIVMLGTDLHIRYMNAAARALAGTDYRGKTSADVFRAEDAGTPADALARAAETRRAHRGETRAHPGGKTLDITYAAAPMLNAAGDMTCILQFIVDLTEIKETQRKITEAVARAMQISDRVAEASGQLSLRVGQVTQGTEVQRARVGATVTAMEEMNAAVLEVARNAGQSSEQAQTTRDRASHGEQLVVQVIAAIRQVNAVAQELQSDMQQLGAQADSIGGVMNVISDIADQTNLLALNAAIEAARAGEAGRGFAVVADEVRKLAEKTMTATTEVGSSIKGIQRATGVNIQRVDAAAKSVEQATDMAGASGSALQEIVSLAGQNAALIAGIATAAEEQSLTSEKINRSIEEINRIAADAATGMEDSAAAVRDLSRMAQDLKMILDSLRA
ncbi:MAG: methyl-accepting chemotaxis protein [Desulfovibrio sp.]|jgi:methyl-accepting chemotaxis protein|nr:methyl-accepting chemotaxis protein [Desulfovibrio sp.]